MAHAAEMVAARKPFFMTNRFLAGSWERARLYVVRQCATNQVWLFWDRDHNPDPQSRDGTWIAADMSGPRRDPRDQGAMERLTRGLPRKRVVTASEGTTHRAALHGGYTEWRELMESLGNPPMPPPELEDVSRRLSATPGGGKVVQDLDFWAPRPKRRRVKRKTVGNDTSTFVKGWSDRWEVDGKMVSMRPFRTTRDEVRGRKVDGRFVVHVGAGLPVMLAWHEPSVGVGTGRRHAGTWHVTKNVHETIRAYVFLRRPHMQRKFLAGKFLVPVIAKAERTLKSMRGEKKWEEPEFMARQVWHVTAGLGAPVPGFAKVLMDFATICAARARGTLDDETWDTSLFFARDRADKAAPGGLGIERVHRLVAMHGLDMDGRLVRHG